MEPDILDLILKFEMLNIMCFSRSSVNSCVQKHTSLSNLLLHPWSPSEPTQESPRLLTDTYWKLPHKTSVFFFVQGLFLLIFDLGLLVVIVCLCIHIVYNTFKLNAERDAKITQSKFSL